MFKLYAEMKSDGAVVAYNSFDTEDYTFDF